MAKKEEQQESGRMGRPTVFENPVPFEIKQLSGDLAAKFNARRGTMTKRAYLEHLLRTHPELQDEISGK